jgi:hypothetical protein
MQGIKNATQATATTKQQRQQHQQQANPREGPLRNPKELSGGRAGEGKDNEGQATTTKSTPGDNNNNDSHDDNDGDDGDSNNSNNTILHGNECARAENRTRASTDVLASYPVSPARPGVNTNTNNDNNADDDNNDSTAPIGTATSVGCSARLGCGCGGLPPHSVLCLVNTY